MLKKTTYLILLGLVAGSAWGAATRTIDADLIRSSDRTKTWTPPSSTQTLVGETSSQTLTNKTIDADSNTLSNIENADIKAGAAIDRSKIANGTANAIVINDSGGALSGLVGSSAGDVPAWSGSAWVSSTPSTAPSDVKNLQNLGLSASVGSSALTIALKQSDGSTNPAAAGGAVKIAFRSSTATSGAYNLRSVTSALSVVISSGSTLGHASGADSYIYVYAIDNSGTVELAVSSALFDEGSLQTTTAEGGAGASDANRTLYSTTARTNVPIRVIGKLKSNQVTAGTWALVPTEISVGNWLERYDVSASMQGSTTTHASTTDVQVVFGTVDYDPSNSINSGKTTYTCPVTGKYRVSATLLSASVAWTQGESFGPVLYVNGSRYRAMGKTVAATTGTYRLWGVGSIEAVCTSGQTLSVYVYSDKNGAIPAGADNAWATFSLIK
jgi:hypothetical protein